MESWEYALVLFLFLVMLSPIILIIALATEAWWPLWVFLGILLLAILFRVIVSLGFTPLGKAYREQKKTKHEIDDLFKKK